MEVLPELIMQTLGKKGTERGEDVPVHVQGRYPQGSAALWPGWSGQSIVAIREGGGAGMSPVARPTGCNRQAGCRGRLGAKGLAREQEEVSGENCFPQGVIAL